VKPIVVCEDGQEYLERFVRFFGGELQFQRVEDLAGALAACQRGAAGLLLDLDFRRLDPARLVDEGGVTARDRRPDEARRLAEVQGVLILRGLRAAGVTVPALLFADLDDPARVAFLERTLAPLAVIPGSEGLGSVGARLRGWAHAPDHPTGRAG
jgi:hypothetical protein